MQIKNYHEFTKAGISEIEKEEIVSDIEAKNSEISEDTHAEMAKIEQDRSVRPDSDRLVELLETLEKLETVAQKCRRSYVMCSDIDLAEKEALKQDMLKAERDCVAAKGEFERFLSEEDYQYG